MYLSDGLGFQKLGFGSGFATWINVRNGGWKKDVLPSLKIFQRGLYRKCFAIFQNHQKWQKFGKNKEMACLFCV